MSLSTVILAQLAQLRGRFDEVGGLLASPDLSADKMRDYGKEYARLEPLVETFRQYESLASQVVEAQELSAGDDPEMAELARGELHDLTQKLNECEQEVKLMLLPDDPDDERNIFLEVRAGAGGDEAALFAGVLVRMYLRYAEERSWQTEVISASASETGGYKSIVIRIGGQDVYARLKFESGGHRVQRIPITESSGRIHTSACTVAVLPELDEIEAEKIDMQEVRVDTYRASGAGGQHVNKTDSAVRLTHLPTGMVVECQDERSQHKNKAKALKLLATRLESAKREEQEQQVSSERKLLVGSGDRSQRIRTYNFPQGRVTDHRINLTLYKLDQFVEGDLDDIITALMQAERAEKLAELERGS